MARMIPVKGEETISRKISVERNDEFGLVHLVNHTVKANKDADDQMVFDRITLQYPGCGDTPTWLLERAAKADWIVIQRKLRELPQAEREAFDGKTIDVTRLEDYFKVRAARAPLADRVKALAAGELTLDDFKATLTKAEQGIWDAMKSLQE